MEINVNKPLIIDYYSDVLCVWAWIAQRRNDELHHKLGDSIQFRYHYIDVFGNAKEKIPNQWRDKGGYQGFARHVIDSGAAYLDTPIHSQVWQKVKPASSASCHLFLKATAIALGEQASSELALTCRQAFFNTCLDISQMSTLFQLAEQAGFATSKIQVALDDGTAMAALMKDYQNAKTLALKGSPSYIIDNGRQVLYGNVGYRVLQANIEEHLKSPTEEASWC